MSKLAGKVAVVTGASKGIGALHEPLVQLGAHPEAEHQLVMNAMALRSPASLRAALR